MIVTKKKKYSGAERSEKEVAAGYKNFLSRAVVKDDSSTVEVKYYYDSKAFTALSGSTSWTSSDVSPTAAGCLFAPQQGQTSRTRIGNKVALYSLDVFGVLYLQGSTGGTGSATIPACKARVVIAWDRQCNSAAAPSSANVFETYGNTLTNFVDALQSVNTFGSMCFVYDKSFCFNKRATNRLYIAGGSATVALAGATQCFKACLDFSKDPIIVNFNSGTSGTITDVVDNNFLIYANAVGTTCNIAYCVRAKFLNL